MRTQVSLHKRSKISRKTQVSMALFLSTDIHQGDERFTVIVEFDYIVMSQTEIGFHERQQLFLRLAWAKAQDFQKHR